MCQTPMNPKGTALLQSCSLPSCLAPEEGGMLECSHLSHRHVVIAGAEFAVSTPPLAPSLQLEPSPSKGIRSTQKAPVAAAEANPSPSSSPHTCLPSAPASHTRVLSLVGEDLCCQPLGVQQLGEAAHDGIHQVRVEDAAQLDVHAGPLLSKLLRASPGP